MGIEYVHGKLYDLVLDGFENDKDTFPSQFFGTPMWDNLVIDSDDLKLRIDMVLLTVSQTKNIVKTALNGVDGTVKEFISDGDYNIQISGGLFGLNNQYPEDEVAKLITILKKKTNIRVQSQFLQRFDIDDIVVENYKMEAKEAQGNAQFFEISAVSDTPQELIMSAKNTDNIDFAYVA
jgi:hypothetical protein